MFFFLPSSNANLASNLSDGSFYIIIYISIYCRLCLHAGQPCTFFKSYMHGSFFTVFCHVLLHLLCTAVITVKQVIITQKQQNIYKIDTIKLV